MFARLQQKKKKKNINQSNVAHENLQSLKHVQGQSLTEKFWFNLTTDEWDFHYEEEKMCGTAEKIELFIELKPVVVERSDSN